MLVHTITMFGNRVFRVFIGIALIAALLGAGWFAWYQEQENKSFESRLAMVSSELGTLAAALQQSGAVNSATITRLQQIASSSQAIAKQEQVPTLTAAVARVVPAVVSIVVSKEVPKLQVQYENPFGNDPMFQGFGIQIPVYTQVGTTTQEVAAGTGFLIRSNGYILTNRHVVADSSASYTVLLASGKQQQGAVVYRDPNNDVAIIKIAGSGYPVAALGDSSQLELGQTVAAIGNALGQYSNSVSTGIISGLGRTIQAQDENGNVEQLSGVIQTDAAINPGNSGGPLLDLSGNVIGINVATVVGSNNIAFSIPINSVKAITAKVF